MHQIAERVEPTTIYARRSHAWLVLLICGGITLGAAFLLLGALASSSYAGALGCLAFVVVFGLFAIPALRELRGRLPGLHLDEEGLECAYGRIAWSAVRSVRYVDGGDYRDYLVFASQPGTVWEPTEARYSSWMLRLHGVGWPRRKKELRMNCWTDRTSALATIKTYYTGAVVTS